MRANINQAVCVIRPDTQKYIPEYLTLFLNSDQGLQSLFSDVVDVARANISLDNIRHTRVSFPSLIEQREIVGRVEALFALADRIEANHKTLQQKVDDLPHAILSKAFNGKLFSRNLSQCPQDTDTFLAAEPEIAHNVGK